MGKKILVVDDSAVLRASVKFTLMSAGFEVVEAHDGKHGLEVLKQMVTAGDRPVIILTDINMPVMDGISFIKYVKQTSCKFVPILVLTTESQEVKKNEGKDAGASGWLVKPFKDDQLTAVVKKFVRD
ncbi:MAG: response regulator [Myxococcales bacterium]|jgi:two-component system chemotaxis response regulator CheY